MTTPAEQFARDLAAGLAVLGVAGAALSPGSRNAPLSLAFEAEPNIDTSVHHDERSAAFFALGMAKAAHHPAVLVSTSGTAAAHYLPALIEARQARIPLIVVTADRPPEMRGAGAPQTIDQIKLYGTAVKWFHDAGVPDDTVAGRAADTAIRLWVAATESPQGPVHLNVPLREPLVTGPTPAATAVLKPSRPALGRRELAAEDRDRLVEAFSGRRSILVADGALGEGFASAAATFAEAAEIPVIAGPQTRFPSPNTLAYGDLAAATGFLARHAPDLVIRVGPVPTSKAVWRWMETSGVPQVYLDEGPWRDPLGSATDVYRVDPGAALEAIAGTVAPAPSGWLQSWLQADAAIDEAVAAALAAEPFPNEPAIARAVYRAAPSGSLVFTGSSMPIRDLDAVGGSPRRDVDVLANRGANGIDGLLSAAGGAARASGRSVIAHAGDLAVIHDAGALATLGRLALPVTVVVVDNDGGGIFHFLPQADAGVVAPERFERVFATPHGLDVTQIAGAYGVAAASVTSPADLEAAIAHPPAVPCLVRVPTDRTRNVAVHERLRRAVRERLG